MKKNKLLILILLFLCLVKLDVVHTENIYKEYKIGDVVIYNEMGFYVIEDSDSTKDYVTLLKAYPLTVAEINKYGGVGTENNHVNMYVDPNQFDYKTASDVSGYGGMQYYSSSTCGDDSGDWLYSGCTTDYDSSEVKYVVDAWALDKFLNGDLADDKIGYKARLITFDELTNNLGYIRKDGTKYIGLRTENTPSWAYNNDYWYWTMEKYDNSDMYVWIIYYDGGARTYSVSSSGGPMDNGWYVHSDPGVVRPVINLKKEVIPSFKKLTDKEFKIGDIVEYNNMLFYVIKNSTEKDDSVTMLKAEPLTVDEVNKYGGVGTENNHVNMYSISSKTESYYQKSYDQNGYGGMSYYSSKTCGYDTSGKYLSDGCTTDYQSSEVKYVVDAWANDKLNVSDLIEDNLGYKTRLLTYEDLTNNLGYTRITGTSLMFLEPENIPFWVHNNDYSYWTMSGYEDSNSNVWRVISNGQASDMSVGHYYNNVVRPVVTLKKATENSSENVETEKEEDNIKNEVTENNGKPNQIISVPDTLLNRTVISVIVGIILIIIGIVIIYVIKTKKEFKLFLKKKDKK